jgi:DnaJ-class molecular chaperone
MTSPEGGNECPSCYGKGGTPMIACGPGFSRLDPSHPCRTCGGTGRVDDARLEQIRAARRMRADRLHRGFTQRQEATRLGMTPQEYSRMEHP